MTGTSVRDPRFGELVNGGPSFWHLQAPAPKSRPGLDGDTSCDVAIVGGGLTGLWTAYYLKQACPDLDVVLLEARTVGYGASGRNGGWLSSEIGGSREAYAERGGRQATIRLARAMQEAVDEVIAVAGREGIDADIVKGGTISVARTNSQLVRLRHQVDHLNSWGSEHRLLDADEVSRRIRVAGALGASFSRHCARVSPLKLTRGLADAVERRGVRIFENTRCTGIGPGTASTEHGLVRAQIVLRCLEGYTGSIPGKRRELLPMNSSMIVTEPLPSGLWDEIGWSGCETLGDAAHGYTYAQRTADGRIAVGGRGVPYRFASRTDHGGQTQLSTVQVLADAVTEMFPVLGSVRITHAWCGVLGVPRDWCATVDFDPVSGLGAANGYVGSGLTTTNLAARSLAALALKDAKAPEASLPWVGRKVRKWEPEPLRWMGVNTIYRLYHAADRSETRRGDGRTSAWALLADRIAGRA